MTNTVSISTDTAALAKSVVFAAKMEAEKKLEFWKEAVARECDVRRQIEFWSAECTRLKLAFGELHRVL